MAQTFTCVMLGRENVERSGVKGQGSDVISFNYCFGVGSRKDEREDRENGKGCKVRVRSGKGWCCVILITTVCVLVLFCICLSEGLY